MKTLKSKNFVFLVFLHSAFGNSECSSYPIDITSNLRTEYVHDNFIFEGNLSYYKK